MWVGAGQLLSNHIAVETDGNVKRFNREGLRQLQCCNTMWEWSCNVQYTYIRSCNNASGYRLYALRNDARELM